MLPRGAILGGVAVAVAAFYCKLWKVQVLKEQDVLLQQLQQSYRPAQEPVLLMLGRGFFFVATAAWVVLSLQSLVAGVQRARYKPKVRQQLQPLSEQEAKQQQAQPNQPQGTSAAAQPTTGSPVKATADAPAKAMAAQVQQESQDWRDQRRRQALEARQRELDEQAAKLREQQAQEEEARQARKAQAAAEAARKKAEQEAAQAKAREEAEAKRAAAAAELARRREEFAAAARAQWHGLTPPQAMGADEASPSSSQGGSRQTSHQPGSGGGQPRPVFASEPDGLQDRQIRQQQDLEYQQSLERDRAKAAAKEAQRKAAAAALQQQDEQQRLAVLRQTLLKDLGAEPSEDSESTLTLRVRLPGGGQAIRRFSTSLGFDNVFAWVYSLEEMPLWAPGTWALISAFPRRQLAPPSGSTWAPGVWAQQQAGQPGAQALLPGEWMLQVKQLSEDAVFVKVHGETTLEQVQADICARIGAKPDQQRLIFSGQLLQQPYRTLKQLGIGPDHTLQLAVRAASAGGCDASSSDDAIEGAAGDEADTSASAAAAAERARELAKAAQHAYFGSDVLVVSTVAELQEEVAHGASQLALYVEALQTQQYC